MRVNLLSQLCKSSFFLIPCVGVSRVDQRYSIYHYLRILQNTYVSYILHATFLYLNMSYMGCRWYT